MPVSGAATSATRENAARSLTVTEEVLAYLERDRIYAAYAIAQLTDPPSKKTQAMVDESQAPAICVHLKDVELPFLLSMGDQQGVASILSAGLCPWQAYLVYKPDQAGVVESFYRPYRRTAMLRMHVTQDAFLPVEGDAVRLTGLHASKVNQLYTTEMSCHIYPRQIDMGVYYGIWRDGRLAAVAGTHVVSPGQGIGAVGNVLTHALYRGAGCAAICTSAVTQELLGYCRDVVLNVKEDNIAARRVYERLGYREHCLYFEAFGTWRLRRFLGWLTGRRFVT
ncbi:MAG: GNAT family N-acetyltransferase [Chloroflexi bacterium]|nr:GNAT family N-acetyltransferase [Chloroflexota bacterium]